jgi:hypothetical protein
VAAHKYWTMLLANPPATVYPFPVELSEAQLFYGATRLGATITPTCNLAPTTGTLANLRDDSVATSAYWADLSTLLNYNLKLFWEFPVPVEVDGVILGSRTTIARFPLSGFLTGTDSLTDSARCTVRGFGGAKWVSAAKTPLMSLADPMVQGGLIYSVIVGFDSGRGLITDTVKTKGTPSNLPTHCKVRLLRDIDGKALQETWTDPVTGVYVFDSLDPSYTYSVIAVHPLGSFRAVIADRLTPGLMP